MVSVIKIQKSVVRDGTISFIPNFRAYRCFKNRIITVIKRGGIKSGVLRDNSNNGVGVCIKEHMEMDHIKE